MTDGRDSHTTITRFVVLGARGDLVSRHTLPALAVLEGAALLPPGLRVVAIDRDAMTTCDFRSSADQLLDRHAAAVPTAVRRRLVDRLDYRTVDLATAADLADAVTVGPSMVYLALPPDVVPTAADVLLRSSLRPGSRVLVEKPVGFDRPSAAALEASLRELVGEPAVYRIDHFLHHQLLRDVLAVRFESGLLEPLWSRRYVERVDVIWEEAAPVAGRTAFYDRTGALRDMVQSHLLQLLVAVAMEPPVSYESTDLRAARVDLLSRVRPPDPTLAGVRTCRGRYAAGAVRGPGSGTPTPVPAYVEEPGVDAHRLTETYARVDLDVRGPRWDGVRFSLRTGKAIASPRREVRVHFRAPVPGTRERSGGRSTLTFVMGGPGAPGSTRLSLGAREVGGDTSPWDELVVDRPQQPLPASALLLRDALAGDLRWFLAAEEVDHSWRVVDAVLEGWRTGGPALVDYPAGSLGPEPRE